MKTLLLCGIMIPCVAFCQESDDMLDRIADQLLATAEEDVSYEELHETLNHLLANPVDLNIVTREQLRAFMFLNESEINAVLHYRGQQGRFYDVLELQAVPGWTIETIRKVLPFVTIVDPNATIGRSLLHRMIHEQNQYLVIRYERTLEDKPGYQGQSDSSQHYEGNPERYYMRYRVARRNDFSVGFTAETDPGESFRWSPPTGNYGFDFYSGHVQLIHKGLLENLVVGDFQCQFGQGLQLGSAFGLGKTAQTITGIRRSNLGFMPYVSAGESAYLRGTAVTLRIRNPFRVHVFGSWKSIDGTVSPGETSITSIQTTGLHRTARELASKWQISDRDAGMAIDIRFPSFELGGLIHQKERSHPVSPDPSPYNQFQFRGHGFTNVGGYINFSQGAITFFGEYAQTIGYGSAVSAGVMGNLTSKLEMAWLFRHFAVDYFSVYSNPVSENSMPQNEQGMYWGMKYSFSRRLTLHGYLDYFRFPWLRYRVYKPSDGAEGLMRLDYSPRRGVSFFIQARQETKARNKTLDQSLYRVENGTRSGIWISGDIAVTPTLTLKSRIQGSQYELGNVVSRGMAAVQEITWKKDRLSVTARAALFDTDDYENRQYVYEKDVWLATSLPAYEGTGIRNYVLVHFAVTRNIDFWVRWARTAYDDREEIGSGMERIAGNERNDVKFQLRIRP